jgi:carbamoyl-phosphate synthase large subunit
MMITRRCHPSVGGSGEGEGSPDGDRAVDLTTGRTLPPQALTILLSSAGRRVELLDLLRGACAELGVALTLLASDAAPLMSPACHHADDAIRMPPATSRDFVEVMLGSASEWHIDLVIPTIDPELLPLARAARRFATAGTTILVGTPEAVGRCRDKAITMQTLADSGVPVPWTRDSGQRESAWSDPPVGRDLLIKPIDGSASRGIRYLDAGLFAEDRLPSGMILQERVYGREYTTNVYVDRDGVVRAVVPHERISTRGGEVEKARTHHRHDLLTIAHGIVDAIPGMKGPFCFQTIDDADRGPLVIEVNARLGGGYPLAHAAGAPFLRWAIEEHLGMAPAFSDDWTDGLIMLRSDTSYFFHGEGDR